MTDTPTHNHSDASTDELGSFTTPHSSTTWKVLGKIDAADGIGVLGYNTSSSGTATGVQGVTDSVSDGAAGVRGEAAQGSGTNYGVEAVTQSSNQNSAGLRARAPNGGRAIDAKAPAQNAVQASTDGVTKFGVSSKATGTGDTGFAGVPLFAAGTFGLAETDGIGVNTAGLFGLNENDHDGATGVLGWSQDYISTTSGVTYGVKGISRSTGDGSAGVKGETEPTTGQTYGVHGVTSSPEQGAAGVHGEATASTGQIYGVKGVTESLDSNAAGVLGRYTATSEAGYAVAGINDVPDTYSTGVYGEISTTELAGETTFAPTNGVHGKDRSHGGRGVLGEATDTESSNYGVYGRTHSAGGYGVYGETTDPDGIGVYADGQLHAERSVKETGTTNLGRHVATVVNSHPEDGGDVLGLQKKNTTDPSEFTNYISFLDADSQLAQMEGDGQGGVRFTGTVADFAEYFPKADPDRTFESGQVVGLQSGQVVADIGDAELALVVSSAPIVLGNNPMDASARDEYVELALVGQVPVQVAGTVESGDVLIASPTDDGIAVARREVDETDRPVVGVAVASHADGDGKVQTLVGGPGVGALADSNSTIEDSLPEKDIRLAELKTENKELRERIDALESRLAALEGEIGTDPTPADD